LAAIAAVGLSAIFIAHPWQAPPGPAAGEPQAASPKRADFAGYAATSSAHRVADWAATQKANELYGKYYAIVAHPAVKAAPPNYPTEGEAAMVKNDLNWMAQNRERILAEWSKRYESKAAPK